MNNIKLLVLVMLIIWFSLLVFFWLKTDEITRDPCAICSERHGEQVVCTVGAFIPVHRIYYPNGSIYEDRADISIKREVEIWNTSNISLVINNSQKN